MSVPNSDCSGLKLTLKSCYRLMNSLHFRPDLRQENFCDELDDSNPMDECKSFKKEYDKCFNTWFRDKFLKGSNDDSMCSELLKNYTGCVKKAMKDKDIDIRELRRYHSEIGPKDEPGHKN